MSEYTDLMSAVPGHCNPALVTGKIIGEIYKVPRINQKGCTLHCGLQTGFVSIAASASADVSCCIPKHPAARQPGTREWWLYTGDTGVSEAVCGVGRGHEAAAQTAEEGPAAVPGRLRGAATQLQATPAHRQRARRGGQPQPVH